MVGRGNDVIDLLPPCSSKTSRATDSGYFGLVDNGMAVKYHNGLSSPEV